MTDKTRILGQYQTPASVADLVLGFCLRDPGDRIIDPSCGDGTFLGRASLFLDWLDGSDRSLADSSSQSLANSSSQSLAKSSRQRLAESSSDSMADSSSQSLAKSSRQGLAKSSRQRLAQLWGIELDIELAAQAQLAVPQASIICRDFFDMDPWPDVQFDAIVGNPPYTRSEWITQLADVNDQAKQLSMFKGAIDDDAPHLHQRSGAAHLIRNDSELAVLGRRAGLHAFFFIHGLEFIREGGRFGFVLPNSWLDVAYGERLKRFLLEHYQILAIIESNVERWFKRARVNTCIIILEKCADFQARNSNPVHLVRLKRPLSEIVPFDLNDRNRLTSIQQLSSRILSGDSGDNDFSIRVLQQHKLTPGEKWGIYLRSPARYQKRISETALRTLGSWAKLKRGYTTGANDFFYLDSETLSEWPIEKKFRKALLKSLRHVRQRKVSVEDAGNEVLLIESDALLTGTVAEKYIKWGEDQGFHQRRTCASRHRWFSLPHQDQSPLLLPKGIWVRHFAVHVEEGVLVDQQIYRVTLADEVLPLIAAAILNSAWFSLQLELNGRLNFGEGVLWLAQYELEEVLLPDPRYLADTELNRLKSIMRDLINQPVKSILDKSDEGTWGELNEIIFDIMDFTSSDREFVMKSLSERLSARLSKAGSLKEG